MNWLAHVFLSKPDIEFRLGNLLADLVKGRDRAVMSVAFMDGVSQHQAIDAFTDTHAVVRRSRARIGGDLRRAAGILVDVFYDHFLATDWARYSTKPLDSFTARFYRDIRVRRIKLPAEAQMAVERMLHDDRLGSYRRLDGIEATLRRVSLRLAARTGRNFRLERGLSELVANFDGLRGDFAEFFPQLRAHVGEGREAGPDPGHDPARMQASYFPLAHYAGKGQGKGLT